MEEIILETKELCKQYHKQTVLKNINMRIPKARWGRMILPIFKGSIGFLKSD